jgi:hypothetical protein
MTKARTLADFTSDGSLLADGQITVSEVVGAATEQRLASIETRLTALETE